MNIFLNGHREQFCYAMEKRLRPGLNDVPPEIACALVRGCEGQPEDKKIFRLPTAAELQKAKQPEHSASDLLVAMKPLEGLPAKDKVVATFNKLGATGPTAKELVTAGYDAEDATKLARRFDKKPAPPKEAKPANEEAKPPKASGSNKPPKDKR